MESKDQQEIATEGDDSMHLNIDYGKCEGCGGCAEAFPLFFEMRDEKAWIINPGKFVLEENKGVLTICPYYAISIG